MKKSIIAKITSVIVLWSLFSATAAAQTLTCPVVFNDPVDPPADQQTGSCPGRPANRKLTSPSCTTCPLIWIYAYQSSAYHADIQNAVNWWNNQLQFNAVGFDGNVVTDVNAVPTYGAVMQVSTTSSWLTGVWYEHEYRCYRDKTVVYTGGLSQTMRRRAITHMIGHILLRTYFDHSTQTNSVFHKNTTNTAFAALETLYKNWLIRTRNSAVIYDNIVCSMHFECD